MNEIIIYVAVAAVCGIAAFFIFAYLGKKSVAGIRQEAKEDAQKIKNDAASEAKMLKKEAILEAKEEAHQIKNEQEKQFEKIRKEQDEIDKKQKDLQSDLSKKLEFLEVREKDLSNREGNITTREKGISLRETELEKIITQQNDQLQKIAQMTPEEAKQQLMDNMINTAKVEAAAHIKEIKEQAEKDAEKEVKEIILSSIYRCAADHTVESTVSVVNLPSDEMKGRIIGREGRNIRSFETATGIDVIVDDTPEAVILSGYDPVRREVARMSLEKLISDGRIHPTRIEEVVEKSQKEMEVIVREAGEQACFELGIHNLHKDIIYQLGKLNFRTSYGQNVLAHSKEVAMLCGLMAAELELDANLAKRCGLLHDIGKAIDRETEGTHTQIGTDFMRRYKEPEEVVNSVESHHNDVPMLSPYPVLGPGSRCNLRCPSGCPP